MNVPSPCDRCAHLYYDCVLKHDPDARATCKHPLEFLKPIDDRCIGLQYYKEKPRGKDTQRQTEEEG